MTTPAVADGCEQDTTRRLEATLASAIEACRNGVRKPRLSLPPTDPSAGLAGRINDFVDHVIADETRRLQTTVDALTRLVHEVEQQIEERVNELSLIRRVAEISTSHGGSADLHAEILDYALAATGADNASIFLFDPEENLLRLRAARGTKDASPTEITFRPDVGIAGRVFTLRRAMFVPDVNLNSQFESRGNDDDKAVSSLLCLPLEVNGEAVGVLNLSHHEPLFFSPDGERLFMILAHQIAIAVKNSLLYDGLRKMNALLERRVAERTAELAEMLEAKNELLGMTAHDVRNPLAAIVNFAWALGHALPAGAAPEAAELVSAIRGTAEHACQIVNDLLDTEKINAGKLVLNREPVAIRPVLEAAIEVHRLLAANKRITIHTQGIDGDLTLTVDERRISQVVDNLLTNAIKFTPEGGHIHVRLQTEGREAVIEVSDNGVGIAPDDLPHIFGKYVQGRSAHTTRRPGSGLGLAICKKIVEMHEGRIDVASTVGEGSTFRVFLPITAS
jgi:signal transduction histidine kinase